MAEFNVGVVLRATVDKFNKKWQTAKRTVKQSLSSMRTEAKKTSASVQNSMDEMALSSGKAHKSFSALGKIFSAIGFAAAGNFFLGATKSAESATAALKILTGSTKAARSELDFIRRTAQELGIPVRGAVDSFISLSAAAKDTALEGQPIRDVFTSVARAMGRLGKSSADTQGALLALNQMISKGKVSAEELRGQLGERLPGAFQLAAKAMGVTTAELDSMLQSGEILAEDLLPKLAQELDNIYDSGERSDTLSANWNRLVGILGHASERTGEVTGAVSAMSFVLKAASSAVAVLTVGITGMFKGLNAAGTAIAEFFLFLRGKQSFEDFKANAKDAFEAAEIAIADAAEQTFELDALLKKAGDTAKKTGKDVEDLGDKHEGAARKTKAQKAALKDLDKAMKSIGLSSEMLEQGLSKASRNAIVALAALVTSAKASGHQIGQAMEAAANKADSLQSLSDLTLIYQQAVARKMVTEEQAEKVAAMMSARAAELAAALKDTGSETDETRQQLSDLEDQLNRLSNKHIQINISTNSDSDADQQLNKVKQGANEAGNAIKGANKEQQQFLDHLAETGDTMQSWGAGLAFLKFMQGWIGKVSDGLGALSNKAKEFFDSWIKSGGPASKMREVTTESERLRGELDATNKEIRNIQSSLHGTTGALSKWFKEIKLQAEQTRKEFLEQQIAAKAVEESLKGLAYANDAITASAEDALKAYNLLDDAQLSGLRSEIARLKAESDSLRESVESTLRSLQDERDQLAGDDRAIAERAYQEQRKRLEEQYQQAVAAGNVELMRMLEEALTLQQSNHTTKMQQLADEKKARRDINDEIDRGNKLQAKPAEVGPPDSSHPNQQTAGTGPYRNQLPQIDEEILRRIVDAIPAPKVILTLDGREIARATDPHLKEIDRLNQ